MNKYLDTVKNMPQVFTFNEAVFNGDGLLVDLILKETNNCFENKTGFNVKNCLNKSINDWLFDTLEEKEKWLNKIFSLKDSNKFYEFKELVKFNDTWFSLTAFWQNENNVVIVLHETKRYKMAFEEFLEKEKELSKDISLIEERFKSFFDNVPVSIIFYEVLNDGKTAFDYIIKEVNPEALKTENWIKEEVIGKSLGELKVAVDEFGIIPALEHTFKTGKTSYLPVSIYKDDKMEKWFENIIYKLPSNEVVAMYQDRTEEKEKELYIEKLSYKDGLTNLYNRNFFKEKFPYFDSKEALPLTVIIGDISGLKIINDAFGHHIGDKALIKTAKILTEAAGKDYAFRWGGDEFLIILPNTNEKQGQNLRDNIYETFKSVTIEGVAVSISLGRSCKKTEVEQFDEILKEAEDKMYKNKLLTSDTQKSSILITIRQTLFQKSFETEEHIERMVRLAKKVGKKFKLSTDKQNDLARFALVHDIGIVAIDNSILSKPAKLTKEEWNIIKTHPEVGYRIASAIPELRDIAQYILSHHERWDGDGYPRGLKETKIPLLSRILAVVDAYDVMTHDRPYRKALSHEEAIEEIKNNSGTQFDPKVVKAFIEVVTKK